MGTSGAFGGSTSSGWKAAHDALTGVGTGAGGGGGSQGSAGDANAVVSLPDVADAIAAAFQSTDPTLRRPSGRSYAISDLRFGAGRRSGGGSSSGTRSGGTRTGGGGGGRRSLERSAARGAAALAGAFAVATGDASSLTELGLRLGELRALPVGEQCQRILDDVLGAPNHPDDVALRKAILPTMRAVLEQAVTSEEDVIREFLANLVFNASLVELKSKQHAQSLQPNVVLRVEKQVRAFIAKRVNKVKVSVLGRFSPQRFVDRAAQFTSEALNIIRRA